MIATSRRTRLFLRCGLQFMLSRGAAAHAAPVQEVTEPAQDRLVDAQMQVINAEARELAFPLRGIHKRTASVADEGASRFPCSAAKASGSCRSLRTMTMVRRLSEGATSRARFARDVSSRKSCSRSLCDH